ncbi:unnamed protein product [Bursaphelenchus okinawaensis]|uniref:Uncharacterized protein n=1 Tax=Bursaphelenchus okinawaensis TaxID=465554 RepID=A0A811LE25_9BILA|nr:unnamed protein product [Bursaphelenchus okinawaensis]CAG9122167.1 unnamed protein product [Bursaphelenchus okinawaensis]
MVYINRISGSRVSVLAGFHETNSRGDRYGAFFLAFEHDGERVLVRDYCQLKTINGREIHISLSRVGEIPAPPLQANYVDCQAVLIKVLDAGKRSLNEDLTPLLLSVDLNMERLRVTYGQRVFTNQGVIKALDLPDMVVLTRLTVAFGGKSYRVVPIWSWQYDYFSRYCT